MMGFGAGLPLFVVLGFLVFGPKGMHTMLGQLARASAEFDKASRGIKSQLAAQLGGTPPSDQKHDEEPAPGRAA
jgi:Sec-independent protein translocase protein TatA